MHVTLANGAGSVHVRLERNRTISGSVWFGNPSGMSPGHPSGKGVRDFMDDSDDLFLKRKLNVQTKASGILWASGLFEKFSNSCKASGIVSCTARKDEPVSCTVAALFRICFHTLYARRVKHCLASLRFIRLSAPWLLQHTNCKTVWPKELNCNPPLHACSVLNALAPPCTPQDYFPHCAQRSSPSYSNTSRTNHRYQV